MAKSSTKVVGPENIAPDLQGLVVDIDTLTLDPRNARKHNDRNLAAIMASFTQFGQTKPIVVDADGVVLAGNGGLTAAKQLGWTRVAVSRIPLTGADARRYAIADNRTAELAEWDWEELAAQTRELGADAMLDIGWKDYELQPLLQAEWHPAAVDQSYAPPPPHTGGGAPSTQAVSGESPPQEAYHHTTSTSVHLDTQAHEALTDAMGVLAGTNGGDWTLSRTVLALCALLGERE